MGKINYMQDPSIKDVVDVLYRCMNEAIAADDARATHILEALTNVFERAANNPDHFYNYFVHGANSLAPLSFVSFAVKLSAPETRNNFIEYNLPRGYLKDDET